MNLLVTGVKFHLQEQFSGTFIGTKIPQEKTEGENIQNNIQLHGKS